jgi:hypothetical protein
MSSVFGQWPSLSDDDAVIRLVGAFATVLEPMAHNGSLLETNDEWVVARRCMSIETRARVTNTANVRLPAVPDRAETEPRRGTALLHRVSGHEPAG